MIKVLFAILLFSSNLKASTDACHVELFHKIYRTFKSQNLGQKDLIRESNCPEGINQKIVQLLSNAEGSMNTDFLSLEISKDFQGMSVTFQNKKMSFLDLNETLKEQLLAGTNLFFIQSKSMNGLSTIGLLEGEQLRVTCETCQTYGDKNVKLDIANSLTGTMRTLWLNSRVMAKIKVVKAKRSISFQQKALHAEDFYFDEILTMYPENMLTTLDNIHFYKANKTLVQNSVVMNQDIQSLMLVNFGTPVTLTLSNQNISLQKSMMPVRSARFGETIELKGPNNKPIIGKVIDFNKVVIQL